LLAFSTYHDLNPATDDGRFASVDGVKGRLMFVSEARYMPTHWYLIVVGENTWGEDAIPLTGMHNTDLIEFLEPVA
jgi:hypothetical protein